MVSLKVAWFQFTKRILISTRAHLDPLLSHGGYENLEGSLKFNPIMVWNDSCVCLVPNMTYRLMFTSLLHQWKALWPTKSTKDGQWSVSRVQPTPVPLCPTTGGLCWQRIRRCQLNPRYGHTYFFLGLTSLTEQSLCLEYNTQYTGTGMLGWQLFICSVVDWPQGYSQKSWI